MTFAARVQRKGRGCHTTGSSASAPLCASTCRPGYSSTNRRQDQCRRLAVTRTAWSTAAPKHIPDHSLVAGTIVPHNTQGNVPPWDQFQSRRHSPTWAAHNTKLKNTVGSGRSRRYPSIRHIARRFTPGNSFEGVSYIACYTLAFASPSYLLTGGTSGFSCEK